MLDSSFILISFAEENNNVSLLLHFFLGHWNQCQQKRNQKNDLGKHKQLTIKTAFSNAKDASHVAKPRDNESDDDNEVDLDPHSVDIDE